MSLAQMSNDFPLCVYDMNPTQMFATNRLWIPIGQLTAGKESRRVLLGRVFKSLESTLNNLESM
jgi:hypothetical protein